MSSFQMMIEILIKCCTRFVFPFDYLVCVVHAFCAALSCPPPLPPTPPAPPTKPFLLQKCGGHFYSRMIHVTALSPSPNFLLSYNSPDMRLPRSTAPKKYDT